MVNRLMILNIDFSIQKESYLLSMRFSGGSGSSSSSDAEVGECNTVLPPDMSGPFTFRRKPGCQYHMVIRINAANFFYIFLFLIMSFHSRGVSIYLNRFRG